MTHTFLFRTFTRLLEQARRDNHACDGTSMPKVGSGKRITRRRFLSGTVAGAGIALGVPAPRSTVTAPQGSAAPRIAIVGGGIAGLHAAYRLKQAGLVAQVYEARKRLGGRIHSVSDAVGAGLVVELGGELINSDHDDMRTLARELGLTLFNRAADAARFAVPPTAYLLDGQAVSEADVARHLRPLARQIGEDAALLDQDWDTYAQRFDHISVAAYLDQHADKVGVPLVRTLIENAIRTELGVEADCTSVLHLLFLLPTVDGEAVELLGNSDEVFSVEGGTGRLVQRLGERLAGQIHTGKVLQGIARRSAGYRLRFEDGQTVAADYVILALPFAVLRNITLDVKLPSKLRRLIGELDSGTNAKILAGMSSKPWRQERGFVMDAWTDLGFSTAWDATQRQSSREDGALTLFLGGDQVRASDDGSAQAQGRKLVERLDAIVPGIAYAASGSYARTRWHVDQFSNGAYVTFKPGQYTRFGEYLWIEADDPAERQDVRVGNLVFAGEHLSDAFYGYMNGAAETGRLAAAVVARRVAAGAHTSSSEVETIDQ